MPTSRRAAVKRTAGATKPAAIERPRADSAASAAFHKLLERVPGATERPVFGQPAAFVQGHLFFGVFGAQVFVRLAEPDRLRATAELGATPFSPMAGRPMREYVVLPDAVLRRTTDALGWVRKARAYAASLPPNGR